MAFLGDVEIFIEKENETHSVEATKYPVEKGEPFTDHVSKNSSEFSINGYIISDDWETDKNRLIKLMDSGTITKYIGKMTASNVVILNIGGVQRAEMKNGMELSISMR